MSHFRSGLTNLRELLKDLLRPIYRALKLSRRFARWALPAFASLASSSAEADKRVLVVYDTSTQPFTVGELLVMMEASLVLCEMHRANEVDVAVIYDPDDPASQPEFMSYLDEESVLFHLASLLPVVQVNPKLGSLLVFNSHKHFEKFATDNVDRYVIWPNGWLMAARESLAPIVLRQLIGDHHASNLAVPHLSCRPHLARWAKAFYAVHVQPRVPITVNLRNNPVYHQHRNSNIDAWLAFFDHCVGKYPAVFVIICARSEIDARLRARANVIVAKDHDTGVEQDLALIYTSAMHMGANSGPASMAWFNNKPYLMVNTLLRSGLTRRVWTPEMALDVAPGKQRVWFSAPLQHMVSGVESKELLVKEFELMWAAVDADPWAAPAPQIPGEKIEFNNWLR